MCGDTQKMSFHNLMESVYDFFCRRIRGGLVDTMLDNVGPMLRILYDRPHFVDEFWMRVGKVKYKINVFGGSLGDKWDDYPTIRITKMTDQYWKPVVDSMIDITYEDSDEIKICFINNFPIDVEIIRTINQLRKYFGWSERHLEEFYDNIKKYAVKVI